MSCPGCAFPDSFLFLHFLLLCWWSSASSSSPSLQTLHFICCTSSPDHPSPLKISFGMACRHLRFHDIDPSSSCSPPDFLLIYLLIYIRKPGACKSFWMFFSLYCLHLIILRAMSFQAPPSPTVCALARAAVLDR